MRSLKLAVLRWGVLFVCLTVGGIANAQIVIDYTHDDVSNGGTGFFDNSVRKAALEAAVADINEILLLDGFNAVTQDVTTGSSGGGTDLNFDFSYSYENPASGVTETVNDTTIAAGEIRMFVGARILSGPTLGQGGPGGGGLSVSGTVGSGSVEAAITQAELNDQHHRGEGPTMYTLSGTAAGESYSFGVGATVSNMWFDQDTDNNGALDDDLTLDANWHFDHTTAVAAGKDDFYTVALHETLHALGLGGSESWNDLVIGNDFLGAEVIAVHGDGTGIIDSGGGHFVSGLTSFRLSDGSVQEVAMDPNITSGTRKELTILDVAAIRDIGYLTQSASAVPESGALIVLSLAGIPIVLRRKSRTRA